jgi:hypothetical protein
MRSWPRWFSLKIWTINQWSEQEFEDTKGIIRIHKSKDRQHNGQRKKYKRTNNDLQNIHIKLKIEWHNPTKNRGWTQVHSIFSFMCMFCRSLFVLLYFFFWWLCCLFFFDLQILITPLVSSNFSLPLFLFYHTHAAQIF